MVLDSLNGELILILMFGVWEFLVYYLFIENVFGILKLYENVFMIENIILV